MDDNRQTRRSTTGELNPCSSRIAAGREPKRESKKEIRLRVRAELKALTQSEREIASRKLCALLKEQAMWRRAGSILFYDPLPDEVDTWPLLQETLSEGREVCLPRYLPSENTYIASRLRNIELDLLPGRFGIRETSGACPVIPLNQLDLILVPGISFDLYGHRLGRGKGYYDRLLASVRGTKCGLAFDRQITTEIPAEPHDIMLDYIVTPSRCWTVSNSAQP